MKRKSFFFLLAMVLFGVLQSCHSGTSLHPMVIHPDFTKQERACLSEIASEVKYVCLDSSVIIGEIYNLKCTNDYLFVFSGEGTIHVFDHEGRFLKNISQKGRGPGEILSYTDFDVDSLDHSVYILDNRRNVKVFSFDNQFLREILIDDEAYSQAITLHKNNIYLFNNFSFGQLNCNWLVFDTNGNRVSGYKNSLGQFESTVSYKITCTFKSNGNIYYWNSLNDTIFLVSSTKGELGFVFAQGSYRIQQKDLKDHDSFMEMDAPLLTGLFASGSHLLFQYNHIKANEASLGVYNTKTGIYTTAAWGEAGSPNSGLYNGYDSGIAFNPIGQVNNGEYLASSINAFELKAHIASEAFKTSTPKYPEKKRELEQLANSLSNNDNPVLMLVKMKE